MARAPRYALWLLAGACALPPLAHATATVAPVVECPAPSFEGRRQIEETGTIEESTDACWWLSSGARFYIENGRGRTLHGALPSESAWRERYAESNPADTDEGAHPQNLLRLVARGRWVDYRQEVKVRILRLNLSRSAERGDWNGALLFLRYQDSENLYYAGLRVDGTAIIKKKVGGVYTTLAQRPVYGRPEHFDRERKPSLLPLNRWISLAASIQTQEDDAVRITLFVRDGERHDGWREAATALDAETPLLEAGHAGLRADFMDVEFKDYAISGR